MLKSIVNIIQKSTLEIDGSTLICKIKVEDLELIKTLYDERLIENPNIDDCKKDIEYNLDFSIHRLQVHGFYIDFNSFVLQNKYSSPDIDIFILRENEYLKKTLFFTKHQIVIDLINELKSNSKHTYPDADIDNLIIVREEKTLFINLNYESETINTIDDYVCTQINSFIQILKDKNFQDKKNIYLNELVEFGLNYDEEMRFSSLLSDFNVFINNSSATYNFYLRNFSYNKLKLEIDSKAIEFNQKLQGVINDSQTKLIAIPAAFVLVLSSLNYDNMNTPKNIVSVGGLFVFSILLQLFINNQKSVIHFIEENIEYYKSTFKNQDRKEVELSFSKVNSEKKKQIERLILIEVLLWLIPIFTLSMLLFLSNYQLVAILIMFFYSWISANKLLLKY